MLLSASLRLVRGLGTFSARASFKSPGCNAFSPLVNPPRHNRLSKTLRCCAAATNSSAPTAGMAQKPTPAGAWPSPITSELIVSQSKALGAPHILANGDLVWLEGRPAEKGRNVLVRRSTGSGTIEDITPAPDSGLNVRTRVQEYGGGDVVFAETEVFFSNFSDQRLYRQQLLPAVGEPAPLTAEGSKLRFADGVVDAGRNRLICVVEDHSKEGEAVTTVGAVDLASGAVTTLACGADFYSSPRLSPDGNKLAWVSWNHPNMPWDDTELWVAEVAPDGSLTNKSKVAGGEGESVMHPKWSADGWLHFISDAPSGWWNVFTQDSAGNVLPVCPMPAEVGGPAWRFGSNPYEVLSDGRVLAVYSDPKRAGSNLALFDPQTGAVTDLRTPYISFGRLAVHEELHGAITVLTVGGSALLPSAVSYVTASSIDELSKTEPANWQVVTKSNSLEVDPGYLSAPSAVEFPTEGGLTAFMNYYAPTNKDCCLLPGELPPLLVKIHGGPTAQAWSAFSLGIQFWTSRGFAVADVNYGGSTGYGRAYRKRLAGSWGVVDVDDCCNAAKHLAAQGLADPKRLCIDGGSAGGYTTLACLAFRDVFAAGASHYGVADVELLAKETHKFESRYLDGLIGPYPQEAALYKERSPINSLDTLTAPTAFFQGLEDEIVPPNQAQLMHEALKARGVPTALVMFEGEQHGFRQAANIRRALDGELFFYAKALGFPGSMPPGLEPPAIENLAA